MTNLGGKVRICLTFLLFCLFFSLSSPRPVSAGLGDGGYCWFQNYSDINWSDPRPHRYGGNSSPSIPSAIYVDPGEASTTTLYLFCNVYTGPYWGGMQALTRPYTNASFLGPLTGNLVYGSSALGYNDHKKCAIHGSGSGCSIPCCEVNAVGWNWWAGGDGAGYVSYGNSCSNEWSSATLGKVTLDIEKLKAAGPTEESGYMCKSVTIYSGGAAGFNCDGSSGCGDEGSKSFNLNESITQKICAKGSLETEARYTGSVNVDPSGSMSPVDGGYRGPGTKSKFPIVVTYTLTRSASDTYKGSDGPYYSYSDVSQPASASSHWPSGISPGASANVGAATYNVTVPIGTRDQTACFYLTHEDKIIYTSTGARKAGGSSIAKPYTCVNLSNYVDFTASFSGASAGVIQIQPQVSLNAAQTEGTLDNTKRASSGRWVDNFRADEDYEMLFTHTLQNSNTGSMPSFLTSGVSSAWQIEESFDGGTSWANADYGYSAADRVNVTQDPSNIKPLSGTQSFSALGGSAVTVNVNVPVSKLNASNKGRYIHYCQRIHYTSNVYYTTTPHGSSTADGVYDISSSASGYATSTPACVILKNPNWEERIDPETLGADPLLHYITVTGRATIKSVTGATEKPAGSGNWSLDDYRDPSVTFSHTVVRDDSGFDESAPPAGRRFVAAGGTLAGLAAVSANVNAKETYGDSGKVDVPAIPYVYNFSLTDRSKTFDELATFGGRTSPLVLAGESADLCQATYNDPKSWSVAYADWQRRATYEVPSANTAWAYDRTELYSAFAASNGDRFEQAPPTCLHFKRDLNYQITEIHPKGTGKSQSTKVAGEKLELTFQGHVVREDTSINYITDLSKPTVTYVSYIVDGVDHSKLSDAGLNAAVSGGVSSGNACDFITNKTSYAKDCKIISTVSEGDLTLPDASGLSRDYSKGKSAYGPNADGSFSYDFAYTAPTITVPDIPVTQKFCVAIGISNSTSSSSAVFVSRSFCVNVTAYPSVHVWGGNVQTNGGINTSLNSVLRTTTSGEASYSFGSWGDFAVIANGSISNMASGATLADNDTMKSLLNDTCKISPLTFANNECSTHKLGEVGVLMGANKTIIEKVKSKYYDSSLEENKSDFTAYPVVSHDTLATRFNVKAGAVSTLTPVVIYAKGNIQITQNVTLRDRKYSTNYVPQVIIIADNDAEGNPGNILIEDGVTQIDAWLLATGIIDTCYQNTLNESEAIKRLSSNSCNQPLTINGPIIADKLYLHRTHFSDNSLGAESIPDSIIFEPAELLNLSATTYIFSASEATRSRQPNVTYLRQLSPRY